MEIVALIILVIAAIFVFQTFKIVPQQHAWVVERLGKYDRTLAPASAIVQRDNADVAFVVVDDTARLRTLKLGRTLGDDREVTEGLSGGDTVVVDPPETLADGTRVKRAAEAESDSK